MLVKPILEGLVSYRAATSRLIAALALALVLFVQSVTGAFALGTSAGGPQLDAFGNPLCLNDAGHEGGGSGIPDHSKIPSCCTFACSMFWPGVPAPADPYRVVPAVRAETHLAFAHRKAIPEPEPDHRPGNPRAPPLTI